MINPFLLQTREGEKELFEGRKGGKELASLSRSSFFRGGGEVNSFPKEKGIVPAW